MASKEAQVRYLVKKTLFDELKKEIDAEKDEVFEQLTNYSDDTGAKSFQVKLPNGDPVATYTIVQPKPQEKVHDAKLIEWLKENGYSHLVKSQWVPGYEKETVAADAIKELAADVSPEGEYVTADGEIIDGVERLKAKKPTYFMVAYANGTATKKQIIDAWHHGELGELSMNGSLPEVKSAIEDIIEEEETE